MPPLMPGDEVRVADVRQIGPGPMTGLPNSPWFVREVVGVVAMIRLDRGAFDWWTPVSNLRRVEVAV